jgi:hypothetical protein
LKRTILIIAAILLTLSACKSETPNTAPNTFAPVTSPAAEPEPTPTVEPPPTPTSNANTAKPEITPMPFSDTVITFDKPNGFALALPENYAVMLLVDPPDSGYYTGENTMFTVYNKMAFGANEGSGWLFSVERFSLSEYEQFVSGRRSGYYSFFGKDDGYFYGFGFSTDAQYDPDIAENYYASKNVISFVEQDYIERYNLTPYSDNEFFDREYTYDSEHIYINFYPDIVTTGLKDDVDTFVLSQPVTQGESGIWCVERWVDGEVGSGIMYPHFPDFDGVPSAEYYAALQAECDAGERPDLLDPLQVAFDYALANFTGLDRSLYAITPEELTAEYCDVIAEMPTETIGWYAYFVRGESY